MHVIGKVLPPTENTLTSVKWLHVRKHLLLFPSNDLDKC